MTVSAVHGSYDGKVNADGTVIKGIWFQGQPLQPRVQSDARAKVRLSTGLAPTWDIDGMWLGSIDAGAIRLRHRVSY